MPRIGIIGGSGLYGIKGLITKEKKRIITPFGKPSDEYRIGQIEDIEVVFLPRHGMHHTVPPHMINFRANIYGFKKLGVERIVSVNAAGGIKKGLKPEDIVIPDQIIDMTKTRKSTFYDGKEGVVHIDFAEPYCHEMRWILLKAGRRAKIPLKDGGTYVVAEGPRLETAGEIKAFSLLRCDVVGMTGMPEAALARELEICYVAIVVVANYAAGTTKKKLTTTEVIGVMNSSTEKIKRILENSFKLLPVKRTCLCREALKGAKV